MPIAMPLSEWERIKAHCSDSNDAEAMRKSQYVKYLNKASKAMTKSWPNSLENVNRRNEEQRLARIRAAEEANEKFYAEYMRKQKENQARLMERARDQFFKNKDSPKTLLRAVLECATLHERAIQIQFNNKLNSEKAELERLDAQHRTDEASRWLQEQKNKRRARFLLNKQFQQDISRQKQEMTDRIRNEREEEIRLEIEDNKKAKEQMKSIKECEELFRLNERNRIKADMEQASKEVRERKNEEDLRERLDEQLRQIYQQYKHRVDCRRADTEKELKAEKQRVLDNISNKLKTGTEERDRKEQEALEAAVREQDARTDARHEVDRKKEEGFIKDRREQRRKFLEDQERMKHEEETRQTWDMLNRFKSDELTKEFEQKQRERDWAKTLQHREDLIKLWKERTDREAAQAEAWRYFHGELAEKRLRDADNKLLRHAQLLQQEAEQAGRPTYPLDRAIEMYRRMYELYPAKPLPSSQQEHFQGYATVDRTQPTDDGLPPINKPMANGLQEKQTNKLDKYENVTEDSYKRQGTVNGLQEKPTKLDDKIKLPTITCVPVTPSQCCCKRLLPK